MRRSTPMKALTVALPLFLTSCVTREYYHAAPPLSKQELIELHRAGRSDGELIQTLNESGIDFRLSSDEVLELHQAGVHEGVIQAAVSAPVRPVPTARYTPRRVAYYSPDPHLVHDVAHIGLAAMFLGIHLGSPHGHHYRHCR